MEPKQKKPKKRKKVQFTYDTFCAICGENYHSDNHKSCPNCGSSLGLGFPTYYEDEEN